MKGNYYAFNAYKQRNKVYLVFRVETARGYG